MWQPPCLVCFISLWFSLELKACITTSEKFVTLPTNLKIHLIPGIINVTWDCNITESMKTFTVFYAKGNQDTVNISKCFHEHFITSHADFEIHKGINICISSGSEAISVNATQDGRSNTAGENLHCEVFNVSIINCSWTVGKEAPQDTQYILAFRHTELSMQPVSETHIFVPCEEYRQDYFGRQIGCILKSPKIPFDKSVYVQLEGLSREAKIQFFDKYLILKDVVILDPPRNIRLNLTSDELKITWDPPETHATYGSRQFKYSINLNGKEHFSEVQSYITHDFRVNDKVNVSLRVRQDSRTYKWSRWSHPQIIDLNPPSEFTSIHFLWVSGIITFAVLLLLISLCYRFQIWKRLFPKIPKPAEKMLATFEHNELMKQNVTKKSLSDDDEEYICLQVLEMPIKDPSQSLNEYRNVS